MKRRIIRKVAQKRDAKAEKAKVPQARSRRSNQKSEVAAPLRAESAPPSDTAAGPKAVTENSVSKEPATSAQQPVEKERRPQVQALDESQGAKTSGNKELSPPEAPAKTVLPPTFKLPVPAILLEADQPSQPDKTGPGEKFAVGAGASARQVAPAT